MFGEAHPMIFTIGHSTRTWAEFVSLLERHRIELLVDVRHFPSSRRAPWATKASLPKALASCGIEYEHLAALGGYRKAHADSMNLGWRNASFRGYADYMATPEFEAGVQRLLTLAASRRTGIMCAEAVPWKCHRSLLSDALTARGAHVVHILGPAATQDHRLTAFAKVHGGHITYPAPAGKDV